MLAGFLTLMLYLFCFILSFILFLFNRNVEVSDQLIKKLTFQVYLFGKFSTFKHFLTKCFLIASFLFHFSELKLLGNT